MKVLLLANGTIHDYTATAVCTAPDDCDRIIACDGGLVHARALGVTPDIILGDMDSAPTALLAEYRALGVPIRDFPVEKDDTDLALGIAYALKLRGITGLTVLGATGGRFDHALANIHALTVALASRIPAEIISERVRISLLGSLTIGTVQQALSAAHGATRRPVTLDAQNILDAQDTQSMESYTHVFKDRNYETISLLPLTTTVTGVVTRGLKYPLRGETLHIGSTRGVSNAFTEAANASVTVSNGVLIIICYR